MNLKSPAKKPTASMQTLRRVMVRAFRVSLLIAVVLCLRPPSIAPDETATPLVSVQKMFPNATALLPQTDGLTSVLDANNLTVGFVVRSLPHTKNIIGYSGPSDVLIGLNNNHQIIRVTILASGDTRDHVEQIQQDPAFAHAFNGWQWGGDFKPDEIDAVSGATLTSLAIIESVAVRLGGPRPSLKFPDPLTLEEAQRVFPEATLLGESANNKGVPVFDASEDLLGYILRTSPHSDSILGYQGPSDSLIAVHADGGIGVMALHETYDNQRYADYVKNDRYFNQIFQGMTLDQLGALDPQQPGIPGVDGVSGATMTSVAVVEAVLNRARAAQTSKTDQRATRFISLKPRDIATLLAIALGCTIALTRQRANRKARLALQLYLVLVLGLWVGDMVSLVLLSGWASGSVPLKSAPGLVTLVALAFVLPLITGKQVYCQHLCPHGAAQELAFRLTPWRLALPKHLKKWLKTLPLLLLVLGVTIIILRLPVGLESLEAFDAWVIGVGGIATCAIAISGLLASTSIPHAYCKYGCPTGLILDYTRSSKRDDRLSRKDAVASVLVATAFILKSLPEFQFPAIL